jgi:hypothetical protein
VAIPLILTGSVPFNPVIQATNTVEEGPGLVATGGGDNSAFFGGDGVLGVGGAGLISGDGVTGRGGRGGNGGGRGVVGLGGSSGGLIAGEGVAAFGGNGLEATTIGGPGILARGGNSDAAGGDGIIARSGFGSPNGRAGSFEGDVEILGALNVTGTKNFKIDHPLDPENKYLYHAAIESSEVLNIYSGNVRVDQGRSRRRVTRVVSGDQQRLPLLAHPDRSGQLSSLCCRGNYRRPFQDRRRCGWNEGLMAGNRCSLR